MFFRRKRPQAPGFEERVADLREAGFETSAQPGGRVLVGRGACAARIEDSPDGPSIVLAGWLRGGAMARLVDVGFQKFWRTPDGRETPARAEDLSQLHAFEEDLRETLGLVSLYNTSLGTTNNLHLYDRVTPPSASKSR